MLLTPHVFLGIFLASHFDPWLGLPAALISHYIFDFFYPHWNPHLFTEMKQSGKLSYTTLNIIVLDAMSAVGVMLFFMYQAANTTNAIIILLGAILSILPDFLEIPFYFLNSKNKWLKKMITFEHLYQARANIFWGNLSQMLVCILCGWGLLQ